MNPGVLESLLNQGPMVAMLVVAVLYFYGRDKRNDRRTEQMQKKCEEREEMLSSRLEKVEDRQREDMKEIIAACSSFIQVNTKIAESGGFPAVPRMGNQG